MIMLNKKLDTMVKEAMGDTPINLDSGEDRSVVMYSCKVKDKIYGKMPLIRVQKCVEVVQNVLKRDQI